MSDTSTPLCTFPGCGATQLVESQERTNNDDINDDYAAKAERGEYDTPPVEPLDLTESLRDSCQRIFHRSGGKCRYCEAADLIESQAQEIARLSNIERRLNAILKACTNLIAERREGFSHGGTVPPLFQKDCALAHQLINIIPLSTEESK